MSRKHFKQLAAALLLIQDRATRQEVVELLIPMLRESNERFDRGRFMAAVGLE
ncbi:hypothetical protein MASR1M60_14160 [Rhodocyclaceae bacterium]